MTKYTMNPKAIKALEQVQATIQALIKNEIGAEVEVTIRQQVMVYTEELDKVAAIKNLMSQARSFIQESFYEAEEDMPAGMTLFFAL